MALLEVSGVRVVDSNGVELISDATFKVEKGEILHLVGESGSGKSLTLKVLMGLLPKGLHWKGRILLEGKRIQQHRIRGRRITMVFQNPGASLDPLYTVRFHLNEVLLHTRRLTGMEREDEARRLLKMVGLDPSILDLYPHSLSGGMAQRVAIALALAPRPDLVLFDEPTTALDPSVEVRILSLIRALVEELHLSALLVTHDLSVVKRMGGRVAVMYGGVVVEVGGVEEVLSSPLHPYTLALMKASPFAGEVSPIPGEVLPPDERRGCPFHNRCPRPLPECVTSLPSWRREGERGWRCHAPITDGSSQGRTTSRP